MCGLVVEAPASVHTRTRTPGVRPRKIPYKRPGRKDGPEIVREGEISITAILARRPYALASLRS